MAMLEMAVEVTVVGREIIFMLPNGEQVKYDLMAPSGQEDMRKASEAFLYTKSEYSVLGLQIRSGKEPGEDVVIEMGLGQVRLHPVEARRIGETIKENERDIKAAKEYAVIVARQALPGTHFME